jgi:flavin reductase (DIM6/NTAB) family NADH-FMN oxidoreductase RutF
MHVVPGLKVLYFGTPVVLIGSRNEDGGTNIAPMSSAWWLGQNCMLGLGNEGQTAANLRRDGECVLNLVPSTLAAAVDRIALTTGSRDISERRIGQGYRYVRDKFALGGFTEQPSDLVGPARVAECPIQMECRVTAAHPVNEGCTAFLVEVLRTHVAEELIIPGTHYVDPDAWDPLIMKFCEFYGNGTNVHPSRLAVGWSMPHAKPEATVA